MQSGSVDTGNADRDTHLRSKDFLHAEAFPEIAFRSKGLRSLSETAGPWTARSPSAA